MDVEVCQRIDIDALPGQLTNFDIYRWIYNCLCLQPRRDAMR